jgi:hypothetical protein
MGSHRKLPLLMVHHLFFFNSFLHALPPRRRGPGMGEHTRDVGVKTGNDGEPPPALQHTQHPNKPNEELTPSPLRAARRRRLLPALVTRCVWVLTFVKLLKKGNRCRLPVPPLTRVA